jgi:hypothetical protein
MSGHLETTNKTGTVDSLLPHSYGCSEELRRCKLCGKVHVHEFTLDLDVSLLSSRCMLSCLCLQLRRGGVTASPCTPFGEFIISVLCWCLCRDMLQVGRGQDLGSGRDACLGCEVGRTHGVCSGEGVCVAEGVKGVVFYLSSRYSVV